MITVLYLMNIKIMKIYSEVISNTKNFLYKILLNGVAKDQDFAKLTGN